MLGLNDFFLFYNFGRSVIVKIHKNKMIFQLTRVAIKICGYIGRKYIFKLNKYFIDEGFQLTCVAIKKYEDISAKIVRFLKL